MKAKLRNTNNRGSAMLVAAGSNDQTSEQVMVRAPEQTMVRGLAPAANAKAKAQP